MWPVMRGHRLADPIMGRQIPSRSEVDISEPQITQEVQQSVREKRITVVPKQEQSTLAAVRSLPLTRQAAAAVQRPSAAGTMFREVRSIYPAVRSLRPVHTEPALAAVRVRMAEQ